MSEKKSKLKKILIPIIIVVLIATAVCLFFVFKAKNNNKKNNNPVENVNSNSIESEINSDIINQKISPEYNGNYIFQAVMHIELDSNLSIDELNKTYKALANNNVNVKDANTYYSFLSDKKNYNKTKEISEKLLETKKKQQAFKEAFGKTYINEFKDYVFVNPQGKLLRPDYVTQHFRLLLNKIGMKPIRFHDLRHSCASLLLAKGIKMKSIQEWLGHSCYSTTANLYAHLDSNSKKESANALFSALQLTETKKENETNANLFANIDKKTIERSNRKLRAEFTFDNFVIGDSNRFAFITSMKVAESPYSVLNPLYLFGDVGLGKTHLMMAIGHYILDKNINAKVVYTSAQQFTEDFFLYTRKENDNIEYFYNKYRDVDILLVDDIQLLENKPATQEEFFKIFDYLHENNKQIVITSDRMASELKIMSRLKSRFSWGMPVDIQAPDRDLRINILRRKLEFLIANPNDVPLECLEIIADLFTNNIRELEGALRRFVTWCVSLNLEFTKENALISLEGISPKNNNTFQDDTDKLVGKVKNIIATYFQISENDLISNSRKPHLVYARNLCFYIIRNKYNVSFKKIGEQFGNKDYTTVMHGFDRVKDVLDSDSKVKSDVSYIESKLN